MYTHDHELNSIYKEYILDLYRNPKNKKKIENPTHLSTKRNASCGDELTVYLVITDGMVTDVGFDGIGCAISQASASLLTEHVKGKSLEDVRRLTEEDVLKLLGIEIGITRTKCALLAYNSCMNAIEHG